MNAEAIAWLEDRPLDYHSAVEMYGDISREHEDTDIGETMPCIQNNFFDLKDDHEKNGDGNCMRCRHARVSNSLLVIGDDDD